MSSVQETQVTLPTELVKQLEAQAKAHGLGLVAYLKFVTRIKDRQHDAEFNDAAKFAFSKYPNTLRKLAH